MPLFRLAFVRLSPTTLAPSKCAHYKFASTWCKDAALHSHIGASNRRTPPTSVSRVCWRRLYSSQPGKTTPSIHNSVQAGSSSPAASKTTPSSSAQDQLKRQAKAASQTSKDGELPERLLIYHAGTGRITFLAMLKLTSIFVGAFFGFIMIPSYVKADKPPHEIAGVALCGLIPVLFVAFTSSPFVTHIHIHLPPTARSSRPTLARFINESLPPSTRLTITTMSAIAKPRYSTLAAGDLVDLTARPRRMGLVNYARRESALEEENKKRKWYMYRAVKGFYVQGASAAGEGTGQSGQAAGGDGEHAGRKAGKTSSGGAGVSIGARRYKKSKVGKSAVEGWIWDAIRTKLRDRARAESKAI